MVTHDEHDPLPRRQPADLDLEHLAELSRIRPFLGAGRLLRRVHHLVFGFFPERRRPDGIARRRWSIQAFMTIRYIQELSCAS